MKKTYVLVQVGHNRLCFNNMEDAVECFRIISKSIPVDHNWGALPDGRKGVSWIREDSMNIGMETVAADSIELNSTLQELKDREEAKADIEGGVEVLDEPLTIEFSDVQTH